MTVDGVHDAARCQAVTRLKEKGGDEVNQAKARVLNDLDEGRVQITWQDVVTGAALEEVDAVERVVVVVDAFIGRGDPCLERWTDPGNELAAFALQEVDIAVEICIDGHR